MTTHQYVMDAAFITQVDRNVTDLLLESSTPDNESLRELLETLSLTRNYVLEYIREQIVLETRNRSKLRQQAMSGNADTNNDNALLDFLPPFDNNNSPAHHQSCTTLDEAVNQLSHLLAENKALSSNARAASPLSSSQTHVAYFPTKSKSDTMLFRLGVILQLCLVRIGYVRRAFGESLSARTGQSATTTMRSFWMLGEMVTLAGVLSYGLPRQTSSSSGGRLVSYSTQEQRLAVVLAGTGALSLVVNWLRRTVGSWWVMRKIQNSAHALDKWNAQWEEQRTHFGSGRGSNCQHLSTKEKTVDTNGDDSSSQPTVNLQEKPPKPKRLYKYQSALHLSEGEFRFLMLKRFMDVFYASVDTAVNMTMYSTGVGSTSAQDWQLHLATAAAATYYSLTGAGTKAVEVTSSSKSARQLLEKAWGMVSLPAIKSLSLTASRLAKGAAVADRILIGNISCYILSREPVPELAASLKQSKRKTRSTSAMIHRLSTIDESREHEHVAPSSMNLQQPFARGDSRQRDVILHLTGGGFFAHLFASDVPYLLDWSQATGSVVVCPEYSLLPEKRFPCALQDVESVYHYLRDPNIVSLLGFEVNRIIVTGESAGGNLAAALCVKLRMTITNSSLTSDDSETVFDVSVTDDTDELDRLSEERHRLPDAMMLSCPVLDLTSEHYSADSTPHTNSDPVLPTGLVSAISDAYVPAGIRKNASLISPIYATDDILEHFPPTLIFASSQDSVLDGSVILNQRLGSLGVSSELRAVENLPHAYLGLGTAGFPEAKQAQEQIQEWLVERLKQE